MPFIIGKTIYHLIENSFTLEKSYFAICLYSVPAKVEISLLEDSVVFFKPEIYSICTSIGYTRAGYM